MSKKEESVFEELNRHLSDISEKLEVTNEALIVIATEFYVARRELTTLVKEMNTVLGRLSLAGVKTETKEVSVVQEVKPELKELFPKSEKTRTTEATK